MIFIVLNQIANTVLSLNISRFGSSHNHCTTWICGSYSSTQ